MATAGQQRNGRYVMVLGPGHHRANSRGGVLEHLLVAERALGRPLLLPAQVHHVDENTHNNAPSNLVICQDQSYHWVLHRRARAWEATGNPDAPYCDVCKQYDRKNDMSISTRTSGRVVAYHRSCRAADRAKHTTMAMRRSA